VRKKTGALFKKKCAKRQVHFLREDAQIMVRFLGEGALFKRRCANHGALLREDAQIAVRFLRKVHKN